MKRLLITMVALLSAASPALAQSEGRVSVGVSATLNNTTNDNVDSSLGVGLLVRLNPHPGWGPAGAFNWFKADLRDPAQGDAEFARLQVRPLMGGVAYTIGSEKVLTSFSVVTGPSFNRARFNDSYAPASLESIHADTSWAVRPGVGVTVTLAPRVALVGFGGYLLNRPGIVYRNRAGTEIRDQWSADSVVLSIGAIYSVF